MFAVRDGIVVTSCEGLMSVTCILLDIKHHTKTSCKVAVPGLNAPECGMQLTIAICFSLGNFVAMSHTPALIGQSLYTTREYKWQRGGGYVS